MFQASASQVLVRFFGVGGAEIKGTFFSQETLRTNILGHWNNPVWKRDTEQEYKDAHIEGAVRFDIATVADMSSEYILMLPPPDQFTEQVGQVRLAPIAQKDF